MSETAGSRRRPLVVGVNHRTSSLALRDRLFVEDQSVTDFLNDLAERGVDQALVLSTCDRVEVQAAAGDTSAEQVLEAMAAWAEGEVEEVRAQSYTYENDQAVAHIFRVAASLDSQVIGEPQVFGQVKAAHRMALDAGRMGTDLDALIQCAFSAAKRVLSETKVGQGPVSIAAVAVAISGDLHGDLSGRRGLLIGNGEMGQLVGESLLKGGLGHLSVTHPVAARAVPLAHALDCHRVGYENLADQLAEADIVLSALGRRELVLNADMVHSALRRRRHRPVFVVDLAVPGDVDPAVNRIDDAFLYDIQDLERLASESQAQRQKQAEAGERIIMEEAAAFMKSRAARGAVPQLSDFRIWAEQVRNQVLAEAPDDAEKATRLLLGRFLHDPTIALKSAAEAGESERALLERALRQLFPGADRQDQKNDNKDDVT